MKKTLSLIAITATIAIFWFVVYYSANFFLKQI